MKIVMTLMVRDEADIIGPMIEHHIRQGVDYFIVTDNGSIDGTTEILKRYEMLGVLELRHDPIQRKQQAKTVTSMARAAYTFHHADWVLNADADEFWIPKDHSKTLKDVFQLIPKAIRAFPVPVIDMTGMPAMQGSGIARLIYRDLRPVDQLRMIGLHAHSTPDVAHIGSPEVEVVQGNHYVNIESAGVPQPGNEVEVLHLPWRSWRQFSRKVDNAGRAYESQTELKPSPNHHGMRDFRRLQEGTLFGWYLLRHPTRDELTAGLESGDFAEDTVLASLDEAIADIPVTDPSARGQRALARMAGEALADLADAELRNAETEQTLREMRSQLAQAQSDLTSSRARAEVAEASLALERNRKVVRLANAVRNAGQRLLRSSQSTVGH